MIQKSLQPPRNVRVLIVDDEPRLRDVLSRAIGSWGFEVATARSGEEALKLMRQQPCDVSILDLNLPAMAGIELFEKLRSLWPEHQVIILTGFGDLESARAAIKLDVVDFLKKPVPLGELEQALHRATQRVHKLPTLETPEKSTPATRTEDPVTLQAVEREHILSALKRNEGNRTATAAELGISRRTLQYKLSEYQQAGFRVD
jgi:two-component system response regulator RegA